MSKARVYADGIGSAVANRTVNRRIADPVTGEVRYENWGEVADRVARGNALLCPDKVDVEMEYGRSLHHLRQASILLSGRHLQHGDADQPSRPQEVFTNCSTASTSFALFYLLLNGSGVGRAYDDHMMLIDWSAMPMVVPVIDSSHKDAMSGEIHVLTHRDAVHLYAGSKVVHYKVPDSREGWAHAVEMIEVMTFKGQHNTVLVLDFSDVRPRGSPIAGMQGRPSSGPAPLMKAISKVAALRDTGMAPWRAAMYVDHYLAECVLVGGARRAARMATKTWRDASAIDFVHVKRGGFLWSANNSVTVDKEFWDLVRADGSGPRSQLQHHAKGLFEAVTTASYFDGTGEPGLINQDKLTQNNAGMERYKTGLKIGSKRFQPLPESTELFEALMDRAVTSKYQMIVNPCGEIALAMWGAYCVIGDVVPFFAQNDDDAEDAFRTTVRMLIRTNLMDCLYTEEVARTNRIGVGITGLHEYAYARFGYGWRDLVDEKASQPFWQMLSRFKSAVQMEAREYAGQLGVAVPHTDTTIKPAGTTSKLFSLSEGAHLPAMREYMRWVQFRNDDPLVADYQLKGYPSKKLVTYSGTTVIGFPTQPVICTLGMGDKLVTAAEATPEEQYQYLRLLEKYWIRGVYPDGELLDEDTGNSVSYTLKFDPQLVNFERYQESLLNGQSTVKCCSVMPHGDTSAYEYVPEESITPEDFARYAKILKGEKIEEDVGFEHVACAGGSCPIDFVSSSASPRVE